MDNNNFKRLLDNLLTENVDLKNPELRKEEKWWSAYNHTKISEKKFVIELVKQKFKRNNKSISIMLSPKRNLYLVSNNNDIDKISVIKIPDSDVRQMGGGPGRGGPGKRRR